LATPKLSPGAQRRQSPSTTRLSMPLRRQSYQLGAEKEQKTDKFLFSRGKTPRLIDSVYTESKREQHTVIYAGSCLVTWREFQEKGRSQTESMQLSLDLSMLNTP
ncbi:hypothetical protein KUCAC02_016255, partial [Chaenocephalus aceratus]